MRRYAVLIVFTLAAASGAGAASLASGPRPGASYAGTLADFYNNGPRFQTDGSLRERASFSVSRDGKHVLRFSGDYSYYCGAGHSTIHAASLIIVRGRFGGTGRHVEKGVGTNYFALIGRFGAHGAATITYLDDFVASGRHVADPYSMAYHPPSQACESKVTGTLHAH